MSMINWRQSSLWAPLSILFFGLLVYADSLSGPFIFDDLQSIAHNASIRHLSTWWDVFSDARANGDTVGDRPLLNLSFAIDYALHGAPPFGYHVTNLFIHLLAALTLYGVLRRTFLTPLLRDKFGNDARLLAWAAALLWVIHPLTTEAVTYIVQRAESLASLLYLLTLYCFCVSRESKFPLLWRGLSVCCCLAGVGVKEIVVSAPIVVLLYDRTFWAGSFRAVWQERKRYYLALGFTWVILGIEILSGGSRDHTVGEVAEVSWGGYVLTQFVAVVHYLKLCLWPHPLVLLYTPRVFRNPLEIIPEAMVILTLLAGTILAISRVASPRRCWPAFGFLGAAFFLILAPSSSVVPLKDLIFEHRMYLALATVITLVTLGVYQLWGRRGLWIFVALTTPVLGMLTLLRNADYRSTLAIWSDTAAKQPGNYKTDNSLGLALSDSRRYDEALAEFREVLRLHPQDFLAHCNMGVAYDRLGRRQEALDEYDAALRIDPNAAEAYCDRGTVLDQIGNFTGALEQFQKALQLNPSYPEAEDNIGVTYAEMKRMPEAIQHYQAALRLDSDSVDAHFNLGDAYADEGRFQEAIAEYAKVVALNPRDAEAHYNSGVASIRLGDWKRAMIEFRAALQVEPDYARARASLDWLEAAQKRGGGG